MQSLGKSDRHSKALSVEEIRVAKVLVLRLVQLPLVLSEYNDLEKSLKLRKISDGLVTTGRFEEANDCVQSKILVHRENHVT